MKEKDFREALRKADETWSKATPSSDADVRMRAMFASPRKSASRLAAVAYAFAGCIALGLVLYVANLVAPKSPATAILPVDGGQALTVVTSSQDFKATQKAGDFDLLSGSCQISAPHGVLLHLEAPARLRLEREGVRVMTGRVEVSLESRTTPSTRVMIVSGGQIRAENGHYVVEEHGSDGTLSLLRGAVDFVPSAGRPVHLATGETLRWPTEPSDADASVDDIPTGTHVEREAGD